MKVFLLSFALIATIGVAIASDHDDYGPRRGPPYGGPYGGGPYRGGPYGGGPYRRGPYRGGSPHAGGQAKHGDGYHAGGRYGPCKRDNPTKYYAKCSITQALLNSICRQKSSVPKAA